jgi:hypothetical protein
MIVHDDYSNNCPMTILDEEEVGRLSPLSFRIWISALVC